MLKMDMPQNFSYNKTISRLKRSGLGASYHVTDTSYYRYQSEPTPHLYQVTPTTNALEVHLLHGDRRDSDLRQDIEHNLGLNHPYEAILESVLSVPELTPYLNVFKGLRLGQSSSLYETLISTIIGQQISTEVARKLRERLIQTYGSSFSQDGVTVFSFPQPEKLATANTETLRSLGFNAKKATYLKNIAQLALEGELTREKFQNLDVQEGDAMLQAIPGIGPWTINIARMECLADLDRFVPEDLGIAQALQKLWSRTERPTLKEIRSWADHKAYRSYLSLYLWSILGHLKQQA